MPLSRERLALALVLTVSTIVALVSARPYAGAWNDGSRLATVESLVDRATLAIDDSIFTNVPAERNPFRGVALDRGTLDKLLIDGHYYSDKSPVPALLLAVLYQLLQGLFGLKARLDPEWFCYAMTVLSSGVSYVVAVACVFQFGRTLAMALRWRLLLCGSFALASVAVVYVEHVNNHVLLLGVAAALMLQLSYLDRHARWWRPLAVGGLAGLGYSIDLGAGPPLAACAGLFVAWQARPRLAACGWFAAGLLPWLALHHTLNFAVGGTLGPANAVPEYFNWPDCPFHGAALTGTWHHASFWHFLAYALDMLFGKRGFLGHNLALLLLLPAAVLLWKKRPPEWPLLMFAAAWAAGTWLLYAASSHNYSGANCSIRWFVPLLAPAYYALAVAVQRHPQYRLALLILSGWGLVLMAVAWWHGPWIISMVPGFWPIQAAALLSCGAALWLRGKQYGRAADSSLEPDGAEEENILSTGALTAGSSLEVLHARISVGSFGAGLRSLWPGRRQIQRRNSKKRR